MTLHDRGTQAHDPAPSDVPHELDGAFLRGAPWRRLVVVGDSVAVGVGDRVDGWRVVTWVARLVEALDPAGGGITSLNLGVAGLLAADVRAGQLDAALRFGADLAVVCAGGNDMLRRTFAPAAVARDLDALVGRLTHHGALVVTFGFFDLSVGELLPEDARPALRQRIVALNRVTREVTRRHHGVHVDFFGDLARDRSLLSADQVHPNHRAQAHMAAAVLRALAQRLADAGCEADRPPSRQRC